MVSPASIPDYSQVAWLYGARFRSSDPIPESAIATLAQAMADGAEQRGLRPAMLHGAYGAPFLPEGEVILGAVLAGAPVVRQAAEMREGVLAKRHAATQLPMEHRAEVHTATGEDLSVEESWHGHIAELAEQVRSASELSLEPVPVAGDIDEALVFDDESDGCAWYLVSRAPEGAGAIVYGTLLPTPGAPYGDEVVTTTKCIGEDGPQARLVGRTLVEVGPDAPVACLPASLSYGDWRSDVSRRITELTGKARAVNVYLVATST